MVMKKETLKVCIEEAERFLKRAKELEAANEEDLEYYCYNFKEQAAIKRASMDLSRSLADLRQGR